MNSGIPSDVTSWQIRSLRYSNSAPEGSHSSMALGESIGVAAPSTHGLAHTRRARPKNQNWFAISGMPLASNTKIAQKPRQCSEDLLA